MEVTFTGGEPLLRDDFFDILNEARRLNFAIKLSTNATLIGPSEAVLLGKLKLWEIGVSLYGAKAAIHDEITTIPGSFDRTVDGIKLLREQGLRVKIRSVLMKENVSSDNELERLAADLGAGFAQDPLLTPLSSGSHDNLVHRIDREQLRDSLEKEVRRLFGNFDPEKWEAVRIDKLHSYMCKAGINFCCVNPYGEVVPCVQFQLAAGDLRRQSFQEIWRSSPTFLKLRQTTNNDLEKCPDCRLLPVCFRCPGEAFLVDGNAFGPSSWACLRSELMDKIYNEIKEAF
jgi:radical SAM protein with 4Fe4S-binding SPASM domain